MSQIRMVEKKELLEIINATKAMSEGDFRKAASTEMRGELGELVKYIDKTRKNLQKLSAAVPGSLEGIPQASSQLYEITRETEEAINRVISITEKVIEKEELVSNKFREIREATAAKVADVPAIIRIAGEIEEMRGQNRNDLVDILASLSFQDVTAQKMRKTVALVQNIEVRMLELLVSFGIVKEDWHGDMIEQLKDPANGLGASQGGVDDILKALGM